MRFGCEIALLTAVLAAIGFTRPMLVSATAAAQTLPEGAGKAATERLCAGCHDLTFTISTRMNEEGWAAVVNDMRSKGADGTDAEFAQVIGYLAANMGPPTRVQVDLIADRTKVAPGEKFVLGLRFTSKDGWQAQNVTVDWTLPAGMSLVDARRASAPTGGPAEVYSSGEVRTFAVAAGSSVAQDVATVRGKASYQACKGSCVAESADVTLLIPLGPGGAPANTIEFARAR